MATCKRKSLEPCLIYTNLTSNESRRKPKAQNYKTLRRNIGENIHGTGLYKDF